MSEKEPAVQTKFVDISEGPRHSLGVAGDGRVYSWGSTRSSNNLGQLGRDTAKNKKKVTHPGLVEPFNDNHLKAEKVFVSNSIQKDSGHSAILDKNGRLWMTGCDRWQQLGLGSVNGGSAGYTWKGGRLWQDKFVLSESITTEIQKSQKQMKKIDGDTFSHDDNTRDNSYQTQRMPLSATVPSIRDVALGGDHTLVLSSNKKDIFAFGKCGDGQCGFIGKPYVSAPRRSKLLSSTSSSGSNERHNDSSSGYIAAVCAIESCSITLDDEGKVIQQVGKCTPTSSSASMSSSSVLTSSALSKGIKKCIQNARRRGLINQ